MENSDIRVADAATPGQRLREAREAAGISPREMADRLNWLPLYVAAIEEDRYESLRSPAFVRGYLRAYARAMELPADELVRSFDALIGGGVEEREIVLPTSPASNQKTGLSVIMGTVIAVLVITFLWWQGQSDSSGTPGATGSAAARSAAQSGPPSDAEGADRSRIDTAAVDTAAVDTAAVDKPVARADSISARGSLAEPGAAGALREARGSGRPDSVPQTAATTEDTGTQPEAVIATAEGRAEPDSGAVTGAVSGAAAEAPEGREVDALTVVGGSAAGAAEPVAEAATLEFTFTGDCWLEVRDASGALIYADLERDGDTVRLAGDPPFDVLTGNASAVTLRYRGEPFTVRAPPGRDTARFTVGGQ